MTNSDREGLIFLPHPHTNNHHECEGGIAKSVPRVAVRHNEACLVMTVIVRGGFFYPILTQIIIIHYLHIQSINVDKDLEINLVP